MDLCFSEAKLPTIVDVAKSNQSLSSLVSALGEAGLVDTLNGNGPFTVFAPNNEAFDKIQADEEDPKDIQKLKDTLERHLVQGRTIILEGIKEENTTVRTFGGARITITKADKVTITSDVGAATVIKKDVMASNGVIHVVDAVF